ncbi:FecR family protein [Treponema primitia]|uniref:FecR family protein n=1 Tax=Treponema primitia TaxID=88058 RepID=UPI0005708963|nr:FecR family protein [Treponema primitia]
MKRYVAFCLFVCGLQVLPAQTLAVILDVSGNVEIKAPGAEWVPAVVGQQLENTAMISTTFKSTARISLGNSVLTVRPLTRVTLEELREDTGNERAALHLQTGRIRADVTPPSGGKTDFTVRSPIATASVRGTSFEFDGRRLAVAEGRVRLSGRDRTGVYVSAGHEVITNTATGRTPIAAEAAQEVLSPALPAGIDRAASPSAVNVPAAPEFDVGTIWQ